MKTIPTPTHEFRELRELLKVHLFGYDLSGPLTFCLKVLVIYVFVQVLVLIINFFFHKTAQRKQKRGEDISGTGFIRRLLKTTVYVIGGASFLSLIPGMEKISNSIFASAGILAMAVGLASQEALGNIVSGMFIIFSKPFRVGDYISIDNNVEGTVLAITLRHTELRSLANQHIMIPNSKINTSTIINSTITDRMICKTVEVGVSYDTDLDFAIKVMRDEIMKHPLLRDKRTEADKAAGKPQVAIRVVNLGDSAITLKAWVWADNNADALNLTCDLLKDIKERFDQEKIEIPYPYYNQLVKQA